MGVKLVSFGFAGKGRAIMRGPMVSGVINQLLTTTEWYGMLPVKIDSPNLYKHTSSFELIPLLWISLKSFERIQFIKLFKYSLK